MEEKEKYQIQSYPYLPGEWRRLVKAGEKEVYLVYTTANGSGLDHCRLAPGESWHEGAEELMRVFYTEEKMLEFMNE